MRKLALFLILCLTGCECRMSSGENYDEKARESGRKAYRAGVPATANPDQFRGQQWLDGWIEESEKAKAETKQ